MTEKDFFTLLEDAKNYLDITWKDDDTDKKLSGILMRGMNYLNGKAGAELDYAQEGQPRALLFDYARYARCNALDEFESNYLHDLLDLHFQQRVKEMEADDKSQAAG